MAGTVETNIKVNITSNANEQANNIIKEYSKIKAVIEHSLNDPLGLSEEKLMDLCSKFATLQGQVESLKNSISNVQFADILGQTNALQQQLINFSNKWADAQSKNQGYIENLRDSIHEVQDLINSIKINPFDGSYNKNLNKLSSEMNKLLDDAGLGKYWMGDVPKAYTDAVKQLNAEVQKIVAEHQKDLDIAKQIVAEVEKEQQLRKEQQRYKEGLYKNGIYQGVAYPEGMTPSLFGETTEELNEMDDAINKNNIDIDNLIKALADITKQGKIGEQSILKVAEALGLSKEQLVGLTSTVALGIILITEIVAGFKLWCKAIDETRDTLKNISNQAISLFESIGDAGYDAVNGGINFFIDGIQSMIDILDDAMDTMSQFVDAGVEIKKGYYTLGTYLGADVGNNIVKYTESLKELYNLNSDKFVKNMRGIFAVTSNFDTSSENIEKYVKAFSGLSLDLASFSGEDLSNIMSQLESAINMNVLNSRSALARALDLTDAEIDAFKKLNNQEERSQFLLRRGEIIRGNYEKWLQTSAGKCEQFKNSLRNLNNTFAKFAVAIFSKVAPALTAIANLLNTIINTVAKVIGLDLDNSYDENTTSLADNNNNLSDSIDNVAESAEKAKKSVASYDDVIQLSDNSDNNSDGAFDYSGDMSWLDDWVKETEDTTETLFDKVKKALEEGDWFGAGKLISDAIVDSLNKIDWRNIRNKATKFGAGLASFLNGLLSNPELGASIGDSLANLFNTIFSGIHGFLFGDIDNPNGFDFTNLGKQLGRAWHKFWDTLDERALADDLYGMFMGVIHTVQGFLSEGGISDMLDSFADIIINFFSDFTDDDIQDIVSTVTDVIDDIISGVTSFIIKLNKSGKIKDTLIALIKGLASSLKENASTWGTEIGDMFASFFEGFTLDDIDGLVNSAMTIIDSLFKLLTSAVDRLDNEKVHNVIKTLVTKLLDGLSNNAGNWGESLNKIFNFILDTINNDVLNNENIGKIMNIISDFLEKLNITELLNKILLIKLKLWFLNLYTKFEMYIVPLFKWLANAVKIGLEIVLSLWALSILRLYNNIKEFSEKVKSWWINSVQPFASDFLSLFIKMFNALTEMFNPVKWFKLGYSAGEALFNGIKSIWNKIKNWINNNLISMLNNLKITIPSNKLTDYIGISGGSIGFNIPRLAKGGIVSQATHVIAGEAGKEAILPLENNTSWMDNLANKIAGQINNNSNNSNNSVVLDMSGYVKNFYTKSEMLAFGKQVVEALKLYGVNVSMSY